MEIQRNVAMIHFFTDEIEQVINSVPDTEITPELSAVIYSLGRDAENKEDYEYAFDQLCRLFERENETVKAQVIQALSMMAVLKKEIKKLNKKVVEPMILRAVSCADERNKAIIQDAVDDINYSLKWKLKF